VFERDLTGPTIINVDAKYKTCECNVQKSLLKHILFLNTKLRGI
jgi:hypothetical protein